MNDQVGAPKIKVEIWSDLVCPWCWIGKRRFEAALNASPEKDRFEMVHRAFRLAPGSEVKPIHEVMKQKFNLTPEQASRMMKEMAATALNDGIEFHQEGTLFGDSMDAHRLALWAEPTGLQLKLVENLYHAYFNEKISIFDREELLKRAASVGLDRSAAAKMLDSDAFKTDVSDSEAEANAIGVEGVPFFLFGEKYGVSGAQSAETFGQVIQRVLSEA